MNFTAFVIPGMSGAPEILLIVFVIILLFGGKKLPELARSLGRSLNEFKHGQNESIPEKKEKTAKTEEEKKDTAPDA